MLFYNQFLCFLLAKPDLSLIIVTLVSNLNHIARREYAMKCPVCKNQEYVDIDLHSDGFAEDIIECRVCGTIWSVNHGITEIVNDSQEKSFLEARSECVEGDDYSWGA